VPAAPSNLDKKLSAFLKKARGSMSFTEFSRKTGLPPSTLHRLENGDQSITLGRLDSVMKKLKVSMAEIFRESDK
jgi:transcriptional regulator with XRE-family HTH domain